MSMKNSKDTFRLAAKCSASCANANPIADDHLGDQGVDAKIIKRILNKHNLRVWTRLTILG
jgi:hypothetical protein